MSKKRNEKTKKMNPDIRYSGLIPKKTVIPPKKKKKLQKKIDITLKRLKKCSVATNYISI